MDDSTDDLNRLFAVIHDTRHFENIYSLFIIKVYQIWIRGWINLPILQEVGNNFLFHLVPGVNDGMFSMYVVHCTVL